MKSLVLECGNCKAGLSLPLQDASAFAACPACGAEIRAEVFPALLTGVAPGKSAEKIVVDDESSCFYHPAKKAVVPCDSCGRFLCSLCDVEFHGRRLCPACIESGADKGGILELRNQYYRYDSIALALAITPLLIFYLTVLTAPITIYLALRYWKTPLSVLPRGKWRMGLALVIACLELAGWAAAVFILLGDFHHP